LYFQVRNSDRVPELGLCLETRLGTVGVSGVKRNFWLYAMCACTEQYATYQIR